MNEDWIVHRSYKYIKRTKGKNGKWRYWYKNSKNNRKMSNAEYQQKVNEMNERYRRNVNEMNESYRRDVNEMHNEMNQKYEEEVQRMRNNAANRRQAYAKGYAKGVKNATSAYEKTRKSAAGQVWAGTNPLAIVVDFVSSLLNKAADAIGGNSKKKKK